MDQEANTSCNGRFGIVYPGSKAPTPTPTPTPIPKKSKCTEALEAILAGDPTKVLDPNSRISRYWNDLRSNEFFKDGTADGNWIETMLTKSFVESSFNPRARNGQAAGLFQITQQTMDDISGRVWDRYVMEHSTRKGTFPYAGDFRMNPVANALAGQLNVLEKYRSIRDDPKVNMDLNEVFRRAGDTKAWYPEQIDAVRKALQNAIAENGGDLTKAMAENCEQIMAELSRVNRGVISKYDPKVKPQ